MITVLLIKGQPTDGLVGIGIRSVVVVALEDIGVEVLVALVWMGMGEPEIAELMFIDRDVGKPEILALKEVVVIKSVDV